MSPDSTDAASAGPSRPQLRETLLLPVLLVLVLLGVLALRWWQPGEVTTSPTNGAGRERSWSPSPATDGAAVSLTVDFGNGARRSWAALAWSEGMTIETLLKAASRFRPGLAFSSRGHGKMAFVSSMEGLDNQGDGARNWIYSVNGKLGTESYAARQLEPGDAVLWKFAAYE